MKYPREFLAGDTVGIGRRSRIHSPAAGVDIGHSVPCYSARLMRVPTKHIAGIVCPRIPDRALLHLIGEVDPGRVDTVNKAAEPFSARGVIALQGQKKP